MELSLLLSRGSFMGSLRGKVQPWESWCGQTGKEFLEKSSGIRLSKGLLKERRKKEKRERERERERERKEGRKEEGRKERKEGRRKEGKKERKERKEGKNKRRKEGYWKKEYWKNWTSSQDLVWRVLHRTVTCSELSLNYTGYH